MYQPFRSPAVGLISHDPMPCFAWLLAAAHSIFKKLKIRHRSHWVVASATDGLVRGLYHYTLVVQLPL